MTKEEKEQKAINLLNQLYDLLDEGEILAIRQGYGCCTFDIKRSEIWLKFHDGLNPQAHAHVYRNKTSYD